MGAFVGTPHYAAPEQFVGGAVSEAADVYGTAALLYFTMMARHVVRFADRLDPEDSFQLLCDNLPPQVVRDGDPIADIERINKVLTVAMAVDPKLRCSVTELDAMLEAILADTDPVLPTPHRALSTDPLPPANASVVGVAAALDPPRGEAAAGLDAGVPTAGTPSVAPARGAPRPAQTSPPTLHHRHP